MSKVASGGLKFDPESVFFSPNLTKLQRERALLNRQKRRAKDRSRRQDQNGQNQHTSLYGQGGGVVGSSGLPSHNASEVVTSTDVGSYTPLNVLYFNRQSLRNQFGLLFS